LQTWILRVEPATQQGTRKPLASRLEEMALPVVSGQCNPFQACIDIGPFTSTALRDAAAEMIKYGFGLTSFNIARNAQKAQIDSEL
jgi:hypothetical protein